MPISLTRSMRSMDKVYRNPLFLQDLEDHLPLIVRRGHFLDIGIDPAVALKYSGDFNGLMTALGHASRLHYPSMRLSGLINSTDYQGSTVLIRVISGDYFTLFANTWRVHRRQK